MREGWTYKKLGEICDIYQPKTLSSNMLLPDGKYAVYGANGIIGRYDKYNHESSEVLMTCRGATCGTINVSEPFSWINGNAMVIHPQSDELNKAYLVYVLKGIDLSNVITGAAQPQITRQSLSPTKIPIPPIAEQERIVAELDLLSGIIEKKKEQLKAYDQLAQSIFYTMFGDPIDNPKGWETKKLGQVYKLKSGDGLSAKQFIEGQYPVYGGNGISGYHNSFNMDGDYIIIGRVGAYCGNVRYVSGKFWLTDNAFQLIYDEKEQHPVFIKHLLTVLDLHQYANHAAQPVISNITLKEVKVLFPPLSLQEEFAEKVEAIERQKALVQQSIEETHTMFDYTMDKYFG